MAISAAHRMPDQKRRSFWLKHLRQWHWISSAICLIAMLLFAITGITLNHSAQIEAHPQVTSRHARLPGELLAQLTVQTHTDKDIVPAGVAGWLDRQFSIDLGEQRGEWSTGELYVPLPRPGGDAWLRVDLGNGDVEYESTDRGWISYLNDLHKGRNTGAAWGWFIDIVAVACLVFCITGLFLLQFHAGNRPVTWPLVGLGLVVPLVLLMMSGH